FNPARVPRSHPRSRRETPPPHSDAIFRLLPSGANPSRGRQGRPRPQADPVLPGGPDRAASRGRRPAPSLPSSRGVVHILGPLPPPRADVTSKPRPACPRTSIAKHHTQSLL